MYESIQSVQIILIILSFIIGTEFRCGRAEGGMAQPHRQSRVNFMVYKRQKTPVWQVLNELPYCHIVCLLSYVNHRPDACLCNAIILLDIKTVRRIVLWNTNRVTN